jgi:hypothetical protein
MQLNIRLLAINILCCTQIFAQYPWLGNEKLIKCISDIVLPKGYSRVSVTVDSFDEWLRKLPVKEKSTVYLFDGSLKWNQKAQFAVINIDVGKKDLQQCADALMRLKAEYLWGKKAYKDIHFKFTNGQEASYEKWRVGWRPVLNQKKTKFEWVKKVNEDNSYASFKKYLELIFSYCGTASLEKELLHVNDYRSIKSGDVFIQGGFPGHAVIVVDMAINPKGEKTFLIAQSYMPAQNMHVLKNPENEGFSPWYQLNDSETLATPEWFFKANTLRRFQD